jgi:4-amino-4-deoxy-L-arabinose transferase-like glycosyltransferase
MVNIATRSRIVFPVIVLIVSLAANFGYMALDHAWQMDDSPTYIGPARSLQHGSGFRNINGLFETRRTPGYPIFLLPFLSQPNGLVIAIAMQHLILVALALSVYFFMLSMLGDAAAALAGGLFLAIDIPSIVHANMIVTEILFAALTFAAFVLLARRKSGAASAGIAGIIAGASVLVRPIAFYVAVPLVAVTAIDRRPRRLLRAVVFAISFAILPLAWSARNAVRGGGFTVSTITSWSLLFDRAAATQAMADGGDFGANVQRRRNEFAREAGDPPEAAYSNHILRPADHFHPERYASAGLRVIVRHPFAYLRAYAVAMARTLFGGGATQLHDVAGLPLRFSQAVIVAYTVATTLIAIGGFVWMMRRHRRLALLSGAFVAYYLVASSMAEATSRFRVPVMPIAAIWFGCGAMAAVRSLRRLPRSAQPEHA